MKNYDVIIVGSGPSGLMCAANIKDKSVLLLEKNDSLGGKIKVSGGGKCNVTNKKSSEDILEYIPRNSKFLFSSFSNFSSIEIIDFFEKNGLNLIIKDNDRIFPASGNSQDVIDVLVKVIKSNDVKFKVNYEVNSIKFADSKYIINDNFSCEKLVIATGGKSYSHLGTTGDGYKFAMDFNHDIVEPFACEAPLVSNDVLIQNKELQGVTLVDADIEVFYDKKKIKTIKQNILITHFGLSGPGALHASYYVQEGFLKKKPVYIRIKPNIVPKSVIAYLDLNGYLSFEIHDVKGWKTAFVTAGGVKVKQINPKTFESKLQPNLHFIGEVLDVNAFTGGYNITICFSEGYNCAKNL